MEKYIDEMEKYIDENGILKDNRIIEDIHKSAEMYENGEIVETHDLLLQIVSVLDAWIY